MAAEEEYVDPEPFIRTGRRAGGALLRRPRLGPREANPAWDAARRVHAPAICLLLMAVISALEGLFIALVSRNAQSASNWLWIGVGLIVWFALIAYGAFEMDRLGAYRMAQVAGWMALVPIPLPTYPLTFFASIFVLTRLQERATKMEFRTFQP